MKNKIFGGFVAIAFAIVLAAPAGAQLAPYSQDFESLDPANPDALGGDTWLVFANVFSGADGSYMYGYGVFPAPTTSDGFSRIATGQGDAAQGAQQLVIFSDYLNLDHFFGNWIEANVFQEQIVGAGDVGTTWTFQFDAKAGNINDPSEPNCYTSQLGQPLPGCESTALAFIKTLDPNAGYALTNFILLDTTALPVSWGTYELSIDIDASLPGQILQIGFATTASHYQPSGNFYDNINFAEDTLDCIVGPGNDLPTIMVDACDSGVANQTLDSGCTMNDGIFECEMGSVNHGAFVSCVALKVNAWNDAGLIQGSDNGAILTCAARSNRDRTANFHEIRGQVDESTEGGVSIRQWGQSDSHEDRSQRSRQR